MTMHTINFIMAHVIFPTLLGSLAGWVACRVGFRSGVESVTGKPQPVPISLSQRLRRAVRRWLGVSADLTYPHRIIQLTYYHDYLVGIDGQGDFYKVVLADHTGAMYVELLMRNPLERGAREFAERTSQS